ncbi:efflux transporter outer membrane subunit [Hymenobacter sp. BT646]|uniref:Efflux transporter outer membrane subunit n=1 Tax=Hymenobacter duratus TaxID=2771356 RepID=A0ABR8JE64_9BACT|nr:efflux transporter outer membrane subunit [Hymenobacter duratus]
MRLHSAIVSGLTVLTLASGCRVAAPTEPKASAALPAAFATTPQGPSAVAATTAGGALPTPPADTLSAGALPWRQFFADPALAALIDTALQQNLDLRIAVQRVEAARANYLARRGALLPTVSAVGSAGADRYGRYTLNGVGNFDTNLSPNIEGGQRIPDPLTPDFFIGLRSSWEIDVWGKLKSRRKAAYLRVLASEQGRNFVTTNVVAEVARLYYELLTYDNQLAVLQRNVALQQKALGVMRIQKQAGRATELAVQQFQAQTLRTESLAYETRQRITETEASLNQLLGRYPQPIARGAALPQQTLPARLSAGLPSAALLRRPDVRQAELDLQAARADVDAARAAFLPSLTLTPYVGFNAFRSNMLFDPSSLAFGAVAGLAGPILNRAQLKADQRTAVAANLETYYLYQKTLQTGFREVVTGLKGLENFRAAAALRQQEVDLLTKGVATANDLYVAGYASYLEVITAQRSVLEAELSLAEARQSQLLQSVDLYRALGGGWQQP